MPLLPPFCFSCPVNASGSTSIKAAFDSLPGSRDMHIARHAVSISPAIMRRTVTEVMALVLAGARGIIATTLQGPLILNPRPYRRLNTANKIPMTTGTRRSKVVSIVRWTNPHGAPLPLRLLLLLLLLLLQQRRRAWRIVNPFNRVPVLPDSPG